MKYFLVDEKTLEDIRKATNEWKNLVVKMVGGDVAKLTRGEAQSILEIPTPNEEAEPFDHQFKCTGAVDGFTVTPGWVHFPQFPGESVEYAPEGSLTLNEGEAVYLKVSMEGAGGAPVGRDSLVVSFHVGTPPTKVPPVDVVNVLFIPEESYVVSSIEHGDFVDVVLIARNVDGVLIQDQVGAISWRYAPQSVGNETTVPE